MRWEAVLGDRDLSWGTHAEEGPPPSVAGAPSLPILIFLLFPHSACWDRDGQAAAPWAPRSHSVHLLVQSDPGRGRVRWLTSHMPLRQVGGLWE